MGFDRGDRTYYLSDERLHTFRALPAEEKLRWVEELATFLRLAKPVENTTDNEAVKQKPPAQALESRT